MTPVRYQRSNSQTEKLITNTFCNGNATSSSALSYKNNLTSTSKNLDFSCVDSSDRISGGKQKKKNSITSEELNTMRYSTLSSDCSTYVGLPRVSNENESKFNCKNPYLRENVNVVIGSIVLTIFGAALFVFSMCVMFIPNNMDVHGWIFLVIGFLFFIPGVYHVLFILFVLCKRPGYSFENLPTFKKPPFY